MSCLNELKKSEMSVNTVLLVLVLYILSVNDETGDYWRIGDYVGRTNVLALQGPFTKELALVLRSNELPLTENVVVVRTWRYCLSLVDGHPNGAAADYEEGITLFTLTNDVIPLVVHVLQVKGDMLDLIECSLSHLPPRGRWQF